MENSIKSTSGTEIDINNLIKNILSAKEIAHKEQSKQDLAFPYIELYGGAKEKASPKHVKLAPIEGNLGEILNRVRCRMKETENNYNYLKSLKFLSQNDSAEKMIKKLSKIDIEKIVSEKSRKKIKKRTSISPVSSKKTIENSFEASLSRPRKIVISDVVDMTKYKPQQKKHIYLDSTPSPPPSIKQIRYFLSPNNRKSSFAAENLTDSNNGTKRIYKKRLSSFSPKRNSKASIDRISEDSYSGPRKMELSELVVTGRWKSPIAKPKDLHNSPNSKEYLKPFENSQISA